MSIEDAIAFLTAMTVAFGLFALGCLLEYTGRKIAAWRLRRRMRNLPPPDDPRLRNLVSLRDWKDRERAAARLRAAA